ncbi:MAG: sulfur carrier protein ThiS [Victivallales bacterium]|nr:sulfur carrier protein ThiS [Victivallales bacterium]
MLTINGEKVDAAGKSLAAFLQKAGFDAKRVAVELNLEIIPLKDFEKTILKDDDSLEIVRFVQGG